MGINSIQNTAKIVVKTKVPRVASSARLKGVKGSEKQREKLAAELNDKLFKEIDELFKQKTKARQDAALNNNEILACVKKVLPNISIKMGKEKNSTAEASIFPVADKYKKSIVSFLFSTRGKIEKGVNTDVLRHEMRHVMDLATQPKLLARSNSEFLVGKLKNYTDEKDLKHFDFYERFLYPPKNNPDDKAKLSSLPKRINAHFNDLKSSSEEKIEILQNWRSQLKSENNAYYDEAKFMNKKNPQKYLEEEYGEFLFEPKIKIVEQMLKDEIATVRKESARKYGKANGKN